MDSTVVKVNVGGRIFTTTRSTLQKAQYFSELALETDLSDVLIDRNPDTFQYLLDCLRDNRYISAERLAESQLELDYFGIDCLKAELKHQEVVITVAVDSPFTIMEYQGVPYLKTKATMNVTPGQMLDTKITIALPYSGYIEAIGHDIYHGFGRRFYASGNLTLAIFRTMTFPANDPIVHLVFHRHPKYRVVQK